MVRKSLVLDERLLEEAVALSGERTLLGFRAARAPRLRPTNPGAPRAIVDLARRGLSVLHHDRDDDLLARVSPLEVRSIG